MGGSDKADTLSYFCSGVRWSWGLIAADSWSIGHASGRQCQPFLRLHASEATYLPYPRDVRELRTREGVSICAESPSQASQVKQLLKSFDCGRDRGVIPMPDEERMRIDLVDGWPSKNPRN